MEEGHVVTLADCAQLEGLFGPKGMLTYADPRIAFIGRSNVGKSTLINAILERKWAFSSKTPGKTRAIHFYNAKHLGSIFVDLPGFGFARVSYQERKSWEKLLEQYFRYDTKLRLLCLIFDSRRSEMDLHVADFCAKLGIPFIVIFSKYDCLKNQKLRAESQRHIASMKEALSADELFLSTFIVSSTTKDGIPALRAFIQKGRHGSDL